MGTVADMRKRFELVAATIDVLAKETVSDYAEEIINALQANLSLGFDGNDDYIMPAYRSDSYAQEKQNIGSRAPFGIPDLKYTGSFYSRMAVDWLSDDSFSIISQDVKFRKLMREYGLDVMKLSEGAIQYLRIQFIHPAFVRKIAALTGAEFS